MQPTRVLVVDDEDTIRGLIVQVLQDKALYEAKRSGRNQVCVWEPTRV